MKSFKFGIGRGKPLNPYLRGIMIDLLRRKMKPKQLQLPPEGLISDLEATFLEYTLVHNGTQSWLEYLRWYWAAELIPDPSIWDYLKGPIVETTWHTTTRDLTILRYSLLWHLYDMGEEGAVRLPLALGPGRDLE